MTRHGVYNAAGDELAHRNPRCPRCAGTKGRGTPAGWWCDGCDLVSQGGTVEEWDAYLDQRLQWAEGKHPAQQPPGDPLPVMHRPHEGAPCATCGAPHANRPDPLAPRPPSGTTTVGRWGTDRDLARNLGRARLASARSRQDAPRDPDGRPLTYPSPSAAQAHGGAYDPAQADANLMADAAHHETARSRHRATDEGETA